MLIGVLLALLCPKWSGGVGGTSQYAGPGGWNTPDFLKTGGESCTVAAEPGDLCPKQTETEYRTELTMWVIGSAPLLVSTDIRNLTALQRNVLLNNEVGSTFRWVTFLTVSQPYAPPHAPRVTPSAP